MLFSIILIIILVEERSTLQTKLLWSAIGIFGTNVVNVLRVITIYLTDYYAGKEVGAQVHYLVGYLLFITWLAIFFFVMSRRPLRRKIGPVNSAG
jgi:exosortase/archaeosortase family protein